MEAITPPFFTISVSIANAAVVPGAPAPSSPHSSRILATESPTAGVGASDKSRIPKSTPRRLAASVPTNCPMRETLNAIFLIPSARTSIGFPLYSFAAAKITPGPLTPTERTASPSPGPWNAPAINGLSSGALQKITNFEQPILSLSFVFSAASRTISPMSFTASILIPFLVVPTFTEEQTLSVTANASGIDLINFISPGVIPF